MLVGLSWEWWAGAAALLIGGFFLLRSVLPDFNHYAQGLFGLVSFLAIIIAAILYFTERKDKPKLAFSLQTDAVPIVSAGRRQTEVLIKLVILIENKGARQIKVQCVATDFSGLKLGQPLVRDPSSPSDMTFERLREDIPYEKGLDRNGIRACLRRIEQRWGKAGRPLFMWPHVALEPGEVDDVYFEKAVSCDYSMVRVLAKVRLNPSDKYGYEIKSLIPIADLCAGSARPPGEEATSATLKGG